MGFDKKSVGEMTIKQLSELVDEHMNYNACSDESQEPDENTIGVSGGVNKMKKLVGRNG